MIGELIITGLLCGLGGAAYPLYRLEKEQERTARLINESIDAKARHEKALKDAHADWYSANADRMALKACNDKAAEALDRKIRETRCSLERANARRDGLRALIDNADAIGCTVDKDALTIRESREAVKANDLNVRLSELEELLDMVEGRETADECMLQAFRPVYDLDGQPVKPEKAVD